MKNNPARTAVATMVGTAIEYFDNYIYAMAAVLVFNLQFFNSSDPLANDLYALSTLVLTFFARPVGAILFGHFGDKIGCNKTLVVSLLLMGISTIAIGLLPTYSDIGIWATLFLCLCRVGQGIGLGGEWAGTALSYTVAGIVGGSVFTIFSVKNQCQFRLNWHWDLSRLHLCHFLLGVMAFTRDQAIGVGRDLA